jgi:phytochrome A
MFTFTQLVKLSHYAAFGKLPQYGLHLLLKHAFRFLSYYLHNELNVISKSNLSFIFCGHRCSCLDLEMAEFVLQDVVMAAVSQVLLACQGKGIRVSCNMPEIFMKQLVYGDGVRLQQVLSDVLFVSAKFSPVGCSVGISSKLTKKSIKGNLHLIDLEIRYIN